MYYSVCPVCGCCHDDGAFVNYGSSVYFICLDCEEHYQGNDLILMELLANVDKLINGVYN